MVKMLIFGKVGLQFVNDLVNRNIFFAFHGQVGRGAALAIYAVQVAGFVRYEIHTQRDAQTPGWNRTEQRLVSICATRIHFPIRRIILPTC
jgi:hypothetical protein